MQKNPLPAPIRPEDLGGKETMACRVRDTLVDVPVDRDQNRRGKTSVLLLWEFEGKGLYLNESSKDHLITAFGSDETDDWKDKAVALLIVRSEYVDRTSGRAAMSRKVWVAPPEAWPEILGEKAPKGPKKK
jgi:hypothetical protein